MDMFWYLVSLAVVLWVSVAAWRGRRVRKAAKQFSNDIPAWPIVGHAHHWMGSGEDLPPSLELSTPIKKEKDANLVWLSVIEGETRVSSTVTENILTVFYKDRMKAFTQFGMEAIKQGGLSSIWMGQQFFLLLADPENAEVILRTCLEKDQTVMRFPRMVTGNGLIFAPVAIWRPRRKVLAPMFGQKTLNGFVQVFERQSAVLVEQLRPAADGTDFSVWKYFTTFTFDSICETNLGVKLNAQYNGHPFLDAFVEGSQLVAQRMMQPWFHNDWVYWLLPQHNRLQAALKYMLQFVDQIVEAKRIELAKRMNNGAELNSNENGIGAKNFLEMLIEASGDAGFTALELREEAIVMLIAGTDTSAVATSFATVLLSRYPEQQAKIYDEILEVLGDEDRVLTFEDLPRLKYLEAFLKETLRLYPPAPVTVREVHQDIKLPSGETVVAGMSVCLHIWAMHRNPRYWGADADQFRPERFLEGSLKHPAQFIPFSYGMRNCIGYQYAMMSMKTVMSALVRRYRVLPPAATPAAELKAPLRVKFEIAMKHVDNFVVRLQPRVYDTVHNKTHI